MNASNTVLAVVGAILVAAVLWRLLRRKPRAAHLQAAACPSCGWKGTVSRYAGRCPSCNAAIGELRAKRRPGE